jgi:hypothetical protein
MVVDAAAARGKGVETVVVRDRASTVRRVAILMSVQAVLVGLLVRYRLLDWDEGYHLWSARRIRWGDLIYSDFFYPHPPLFPYLLGPASELGWGSLFLWRAVFGALGILLGGLMLWYLGPTRRGSYLVLYLYALNGVVLAYQAVIQTSSLVVFLGFAAVALMATASQRSRPRGNGLVLAAGVLIGVALGLRISYLPLVIVGIVYVWLSASESCDRWIRVGCFLSGLLLSSLFTISFWIRDPQRFTFDLVGFHLTRHRTWTHLDTLSAVLFQKACVIGRFIAVPQTALVLVLFIGAAIAYRRGRCPRPERSLWLLAWTSLTVFAVHLCISPVIFWYFVQAVPFLIAFCGPYLGDLMERRGRRFMIAFCTVYTVSLVVPLSVYIGGIRPRDRWRYLSEFRKVTSALVQHTAPRDTVLSFDPSYLVLAKRRGVDGQPWQIEIADSFSEEVRERYRIVDPDRLKRAIASGEPAAVVGRFDPEELAYWGVDRTYRIAGRFDRAYVCVRAPGGRK